MTDEQLRAEVDRLRRHNAQLEEQLRLANGREEEARAELGRINADAAAKIASLRAELAAVPVKAIEDVCEVAELDAGDNIANDVRCWLYERSLK